MNVKRCSGYMGHWECLDDYPDHMVPVGEFGSHKSNEVGLQDKCRRCKTYYNRIRPRHPETNQQKMDWITSRAKEYYGAMSKDRKNDVHWKECKDKAMSLKLSEPVSWAK